MDKVIEGLEYLEPKMPFLDVIKIYNQPEKGYILLKKAEE